MNSENLLFGKASLSLYVRESGCKLVPQMKSSSSSEEDKAHNSYFLKSVFHSAQQFLFIPINEGGKDHD